MCFGTSDPSGMSIGTGLFVLILKGYDFSLDRSRRKLQHDVDFIVRQRSETADDDMVVIMKVIWGVILFNLLAIGMALMSVILHPSEMKAWLTTDISEQSKIFAQKADQQTKGIQEQIEKVNVLGSPTPTPKRTPAAALDPEELLKPTVTANHEGDYFGEQSFGTAIPGHLYPFALDKRVIENEMMTLNILIKNKSGFQFKSVNIFMRSKGYPRTQLFSLERWKNNEIALLEYSFPVDEKEVRLADLRVLKVTGEEIGSALTQSGRPQIDVDEEEIDIDLGTVVLFLPEELPRLPSDPEFAMELSTPERERIYLQYSDAYDSLFTAQESLGEFLDEVESMGFENTMLDGKGFDLIRDILDNRSGFSSAARRISLTASRSSDEEIKKLTSVIRENSSVFEKQIEMINNMIPQKQYKIREESLTASSGQ